MAQDARQAMRDEAAARLTRKTQQVDNRDDRGITVGLFSGKGRDDRTRDDQRPRGHVGTHRMGGSGDQKMLRETREGGKVVGWSIGRGAGPGDEHFDR